MLEEVEVSEAFADGVVYRMRAILSRHRKLAPATKSMRIVSFVPRIQINPRHIPRRGNTQGGLEYLLSLPKNWTKIFGEARFRPVLPQKSWYRGNPGAAPGFVFEAPVSPGRFVQTPEGFPYNAPLFRASRVAQLVEQRIENPRVGGSIPSPATISLLYFFPPSAFFQSRNTSRSNPSGYQR